MISKSDTNLCLAHAATRMLSRYCIRKGRYLQAHSLLLRRRLALEWDKAFSDGAASLSREWPRAHRLSLMASARTTCGGRVVGLCPGPEHGTFWASDYDNGVIQAFDLSGNSVAMLSESFVRPRSLSRDDQGRVWVADFGARELVCLNSSGNHLGTFSLETLADGLNRPVSAIARQGFLHAIVSDDAYMERRLITLDSDRGCITHRSRAPAAHLPMDLCVFNQDLLVTSLLPARLMCWRGDANAAFSANHPDLPMPLRNCHTSLDRLYLSAQRFVLALDRSFKPLFHCDLTQAIGHNRVHPGALLAITHQGQHYLCVADQAGPLVHIFKEHGDVST